VPRRGVSGIETSSPFGGQDLASALLQQKQVNAASVPQTNFDSSFDYDPILSKIQALASQTVNNATTNAAQLRKDALISSGLTSVGKELKFDDNTLTAAGQNPESEYAQLQREFAARQKQLEEAMSAQNLLYSGEYANNLSLLNQGRASAEGGIGSRLRDMLAGIDTGLLTSQETARQQALDAATQAALAKHYAEQVNTTGVEDYMGIPGARPAGNGEVKTASSPDQLDTSGGWGVHWTGPGQYTPIKGPQNAAGFSDTYWVKVDNSQSAPPVAPVPSVSTAPPTEADLINMIKNDPSDSNQINIKHVLGGYGIG